SRYKRIIRDQRAVAHERVPERRAEIPGLVVEIAVGGARAGCRSSDLRKIQRESRVILDRAILAERCESCLTHAAPLGGDLNDTICRGGSIKCACSGTLEDIDLLDVFRVDVIESRGRLATHA